MTPEQAALEAECAALRDRMVSLLLSTGQLIVDARLRGRADALQEAADELTARLDSTRTRTEAWRSGIRDAIAAIRARAGTVDPATSPARVPRQQRAPSP